MTLSISDSYLDALANLLGVQQWLSPNADTEYAREKARHYQAVYALVSG